MRRAGKGFGNCHLVRKDPFEPNKILAWTKLYASALERNKTVHASIGTEETGPMAYLEPLLTAGWLERTLPDKPTSPNQRYRIGEAGRAWLERQESNKQVK